MTLPFLRMILHFSHIGFTEGRTFMLVPPVAVIFPQQIQAPSERMLNNYSKIISVFNWKFHLTGTFFEHVFEKQKKSRPKGGPIIASLICLIYLTEDTAGSRKRDSNHEDYCDEEAYNADSKNDLLVCLVLEYAYDTEHKECNAVKYCNE